MSGKDGRAGEKCRHCPSAGFSCKAIETRHRRFCELVDPGHEAYNPAFIAIVRGDSATADPPARPATPGLAADIARTLAISRCPSRQTDGCGCSGGNSLCFRTGFPRAVGRIHCMNCPVAILAAESASPAAPPRNS